MPLNLRFLGGLSTWGCGSKCGKSFQQSMTFFWCPNPCLSGYWSKSTWFLALSRHHTSKVINIMSLCSSFFRRMRSTCKSYEMKKKSLLWPQLSRRRHMTGYGLTGQWKGSDQNQLIAWFLLIASLQLWF